MKAVHLIDTALESRFYVSSEKILKQFQSPADLSKSGKGQVGFIGNVNNHERLQTMLMAILDVLFVHAHLSRDANAAVTHGIARWAVREQIGTITS
ncbi:MAG: hypothetical protein Q9209_001317 [Squamulea sp. 1 TL-2023]